jgi:hypothetical protein
MSETILGTEGGRALTAQGAARRRAWRSGASACFALILTVALLSVLVRAPAKVAATVLAARTQGSW